MKQRPTWQQYFMQIASVVATRSTCLRRQIGAVIVKNKHILTTGYNGAPAGFKHCADRGGCLRDTKHIASGKNQELCYALHAEQNALIQAALHGVSTFGAELYCTTRPCSMCAKMLVNAGIIRVYYVGEYPDDFTKAIFAEGKIELIQMELTPA